MLLVASYAGRAAADATTVSQVESEAAAAASQPDNKAVGPCPKKTLHLDQDAVVPGIASLVLLLAAVVLSLQKERTERAQTWMTVSAFLGVGLFIVAAVDLWAPMRSRWRWDLSLFPAALVVLQGLTIRARGHDKVSSDRAKVHARLAREDRRAVDATLASLDEQMKRYFGATPLALRFGVPAYFIWAFGLGISNELFRELNVDLSRHYRGLTSDLMCLLEAPSSPYDLAWPPQIVIGACYGLLGAYLFVLFQTGLRSFQQDITPGSAVWCAVTLAVGPLVAGTLAATMQDGLWPANADLTKIAVLILAGFSPRYVVGVIETIAKRALPSPVTASMASRSLPVNQVRGIGDGIADRLAEEGITNVTNLARANPVRLFRSTRFDRRQILGWIDSALLMDALPEQWTALERVGITRATSLRWYAVDANVGPERAEKLAALATLAGVDDKILLEASGRLARDMEVLTLLVLNEHDEGLGGDKPGPEDRGTPSAKRENGAMVEVVPT